MRSFSRMFQLLAVAAALLVPSFVLADDPPADEAASKRTAAVLAALTEAKDEYAGSTSIGIHMGGALVGYMHAELKKVGEGYEFKLEARMHVAGAFKANSLTTGTLDASFGLLSLKGESHKEAGGKTENKAYSVEVKDDAHHYTFKGDEGEAKTSKIETDFDSIDAIEILAIRKWITLPAGQMHRFDAFDAEDGDTGVIDVTTSAPRKAGDRDVVDVSVVNHGDKMAVVYSVDAKTGALVEAKLGDGAQAEFKLITAEEIKAWQDANK